MGAVEAYDRFCQCWERVAWSCYWQVVHHKKQVVRKRVHGLRLGQRSPSNLRAAHEAYVNSRAWSTQMCCVPLGLFALLVPTFMVQVYVTRPWSMRIKDTPPSSESVFSTVPHERPPFLNCDYCEPCEPCRECYNGTSEQYEAKYDRCSNSEGPCSYPFGRLQACPVLCAGWLTLGPKRLGCIPYLAVSDQDLPSSQSAMPEMQYIDENVPVVDVADPFAGHLPIPRKNPNIYLPKGYDPSKPYPLLVFTTGRDTRPWVGMHMLALRPLANKFGFILVAPESSESAPFNDAHISLRFCSPAEYLSDPSCLGSDDAKYIWSIVEYIKEKYLVSTVNLWGMSNGGDMTNTMACYYSREIHSVVLLGSGDGYLPSVPNHTTFSPAGCQPEFPIHILYIHDPNDLVSDYSNAVASLEHFAGFNGCDTSVCPTLYKRDDFLPMRYGVQHVLDNMLVAVGLIKQKLRVNETAKFRFEHCEPGGSAELWAVSSVGSDATAVPIFNPPKKVASIGALGHAQTTDSGENQAMTLRVFRRVLALPVVPPEEKQPTQWFLSLQQAPASVEGPTPSVASPPQQYAEAAAVSRPPSPPALLLPWHFPPPSPQPPPPPSSPRRRIFKNFLETNYYNDAPPSPSAKREAYLHGPHRRRAAMLVPVDLNDMKSAHCEVWTDYKRVANLTIREVILLPVLFCVMLAIVVTLAFVFCSLLRWRRHLANNKIVHQYLKKMQVGKSSGVCRASHHAVPSRIIDPENVQRRKEKYSAHEVVSELHSITSRSTLLQPSTQRSDAPVLLMPPRSRMPDAKKVEQQRSLFDFINFRGPEVEDPEDELEDALEDQNGGFFGGEEPFDIDEDEAEEAARLEVAFGRKFRVEAAFAPLAG